MSNPEKKPSASENSSKKVTVAKNHLTKKPPALLADLSNCRNHPLSKPMVPCVSKSNKKTRLHEKGISGDILQVSSNKNSSGLVFPREELSTKNDKLKDGVESFLDPNTDSADINEVVSSDNVVSTISIEIKTNIYNNVNSSESSKIAERIHGGDVITKTETNEAQNNEYNIKDSQICAPTTHGIYEYLRASEEIKRPSVDFMEKIQIEINASMRGILIDWLVEVTGAYRLQPDTLFLTVNCIDRYLSGNAINRRQLQLLGVACMMIVAKYEETCAPEVETFCQVTDNTYSKEQVLQMESDVLNFLKFEVTAPTARYFLRHIINVARQTCKVPSLELGYLADYLALLSLLDYRMLNYPPSLIAASATFLSIYILLPREKPWNSMLQHYTGYQASELHECVEGLRFLFCGGFHNLPAITKKYSQHKFNFVAKKYCPPSIPLEVFRN